MNKPLIIVESPAKAKTIEKYLSNEYDVFACVGHVKDLPKKELGVDVDNNFTAKFVIMEGKEDIMAHIRKKSAKAREVILATDPDREGEAIAAHLAEEISNPLVSRVQFTEITKEGINEGMAHRQQIDTNLVNAQNTRRKIDRLVGYKLSRLLWSTLQKTLRFVNDALSAGRVQSAALKMIVDRERLRRAFVSTPYYNLTAGLETDAMEGFEAELIALDEKKLAASKDFDSATGALINQQALILTESQVKALALEIINGPWIVKSVEEKPQTSRPYPPFITSTLQQEAARKLRFSARKAMSLAQRLYEAGFITYMRTDSIQLSNEALQGARKAIVENFGKEFLPEQPVVYENKVKNAQEAHEAIRPAGSAFAHKTTVISNLGEDEGKLYDLIWKRTLASQMKPAKLKSTIVDIQNQNTLFRARGRVILFPGYMKAYVESSDEQGDALKERESILPDLQTGQRLTCKDLSPTEHRTKAPARYTEASIIKEMEKQGIGRPSTWASIIERIREKDYIQNQKGALVPTFLAVSVTQLLENHFYSLVDSKFTANLEDQLDEISRGETDSLPIMNMFYFGDDLTPGLHQMLNEKIDIRKACMIPISSNGDDNIVIRLGKFGPYLEEGTARKNIPTDIFLGDISLEKAREILAQDKPKPNTLGIDEKTGMPVNLMHGRFGHYVQLGDSKTRKPLPKNIEPQNMDLATALNLLSLPRILGHHPETDAEIRVDFGRFGPYLINGNKNIKLPPPHNPLNITLETALQVISNRNKPSSVVKELGIEPESGNPIQLKDGRYGPYVTDGKVNAAIPKNTNADELSLDEAINLIKIRMEKGPSKRRRRRKK